jgi:hypothetical protein
LLATPPPVKPDRVAADPKLKAIMAEYPNGIPRFSYELRLAKGWSVRPNLELVGGQWCHVVEIEGLETIWVAHDKGMLPMKYCRYRYKGGELIIERQVEEVGEVKTDTGSIWYPRRANSIGLGSTAKYKCRLIVKEFEPNIQVDGDSFTFDFPSGTTVVDHVLGAEYVVGVRDIDEVPVFREFKEPSEEEPRAAASAKTNEASSAVHHSAAEDDEDRLVPANDSEQLCDRAEQGSGSIEPPGATGIARTNNLVALTLAGIALAALLLLFLSKALAKPKDS